MIECPNCGIENPATRAFCQLCGERLPQSPPAPPPPAAAGDEGMLDWLLKEMEPDGEAADEAAPEPAAPPPAAPPAPAERAAPSFLPSWLEGLTVEAAPPAPSAPEWDESVDFSDLPDWEQEEEAASAPSPTEPPGTTRLVGAPSRGTAAAPGSGLLSGISDPIPIEPIITARHQLTGMPAVATEEASEESAEGANLFARIAGGAALPDQAVPPLRRDHRGWLASLLLLVALTVPLLLGGNRLGQPPTDARVTAFAAQIEQLPPERAVLIAFDFEGPLAEELMPGTVAAINQLRAAPGAAPREIRAVSTLPQGAGVAELAWQGSSGGESGWQNLGFVPGSSIGLRSLLESQLRAEDGIALIIVVTSDAQGVQRWIEQVGTQRPVPLLAITPALAEGSLAPYLASGQLDGLLAGLPAAAAYEAALAAPGVALRRLDSTSVGALILLGALLLGLVMAPPARSHE